MVATRGHNSNPARIPALGVRVIILIFVSILLMYLDHRQNHLDAVRKAIGAAVYPVQLIVDAPIRFWEWLGESTTSRTDLGRCLSWTPCLPRRLTMVSNTCVTSLTSPGIAVSGQTV